MKAEVAKPFAANNAPLALLRASTQSEVERVGAKSAASISLACNAILHDSRIRQRKRKPELQHHLFQISERQTRHAKLEKGRRSYSVRLLGLQSI
jgi:hypothetical protein